MSDLDQATVLLCQADVRCPRCGTRAQFRPAFSLVNRETWSAWESELWPSATATDWERRKHWSQGAPPPAWSGSIIIEHAPENHRWKQPPDGYRATNDGTVQCPRCVARFAHELSWPDDAWFRFELPQGLLCAWNDGHARALVRFLASTDKDGRRHAPYQGLLARTPTQFLEARNRASVASRLRSYLEAGMAWNPRRQSWDNSQDL